MKTEIEIKSDAELSACDAELDDIKTKMEKIVGRIDLYNRRAGFEVQQSINALNEARLTIKRDIEKTPLPSLEQIRGLFKKEDLSMPQGCHCHKCLEEIKKTHRRFIFRGMIVCPICGNKRCPHASDHTYACTESNDTGQEGSVFK